MTTDTAAAQAFYKAVIGWGTQKSDMPGMEYTLWLAGENPVGGLAPLMAEAAAMGTPPNWLAYVEVPDADAAVEQAVKLGATVLMPAMSVDQVGRFAILQDPQGAAIGVLTSASQLPSEADPGPREFSWHELGTSDQSGGISFYEQLFGWTKKDEFDMGNMGVYHMFGRDRFTYGGIMKKPAEVPVSYWLHYISVVDSADAAAERAQNAGATLKAGPMEVPGGDRIAILTDPQGAWFAVHSRPAA
jgi:predicted enzyme related to lactoylglutathione lyase